MMNVIGLCLVVASLVSAGIWSPGHTTTKTPSDKDNNLIVKEGHRVVVVEYDQDGEPITKVSISPESHHFNSETSSMSGSLNYVKDKLRESSDGGGGGEWRSPKELICDAYGRCKHRIAEAVGKTKDSVADTAHRTEEAAHGAAEKIRTAAHRAEEAISGAAHEAAERTSRSAAAHRAEDLYGQAKEMARQGAQEVEKEVGEVAKDVKDLGKTIGIDVAKNVTGFAWRLRNEAALLGRVLSPEALNPLSGTLYVLAFATAYGTGVWVTFVEGRVLATALPKSQFAVVQSKLFPVYFRTSAVSVAAAAFWFVMVHRGKVLSSIPELLQLYNLFTSLILVLINTFFLEPRATKVMFERMRVEKEEGRGREEGSQEQQSEPSTNGPEGAEKEAIRNPITELNGKLKKLNTWSSVLNMMCLMGLSWHVFYLGLRLHLTF